MNNNKNKDSFLKGALILGLAGVIVKIMGGFFRIPLGNMIGSEGMGYYQAAYPVYTLFLTLATAGFPTAVAKLVSEKVAIGNFKGANKIFKVSHTVLFITGIISFCILFWSRLHSNKRNEKSRCVILYESHCSSITICSCNVCI